MSEKKTRIITIGRRFGSGGRLIGKALADKLGIAFFDRMLITEAAKESGLCDSFIESFEQTPTSSLLYSLVMNAQNGGFYMGKPVELMAYEAQINAVRSAAAGGECVIVGRCADYILKDDYDVASVFITASPEYRAKAVAEREGISVKDAAAKIVRMDKARASYHNYHAETKWGAADSYELCINSEKLSEQQAADLIAAYLEMRGK
ncbi:MAG: cytidylate kinase-like family protein [Oscillospiraceae bacterium]|nr:cytidylate kinase-like family protein [Oscillospiraceae bacterium]